MFYLLRVYCLKPWCARKRKILLLYSGECCYENTDLFALHWLLEDWLHARRFGWVELDFINM